MPKCAAISCVVCVVSVPPQLFERQIVAHVDARYRISTNIVGCSSASMDHRKRKRVGGEDEDDDKGIHSMASASHSLSQDHTNAIYAVSFHLIFFDVVDIHVCLI